MFICCSATLPPISQLLSLLKWSLLKGQQQGGKREKTGEKSQAGLSCQNFALCACPKEKTINSLLKREDVNFSFTV